MTGTGQGAEGGTARVGVVVDQARWAVMGVIVGVLAGLSSAAFLLALDWATDTRVDQRWLVALLPAAGLAVGLTYHHLGGRAGGGTNLILDEIGEPTAWVPRRMAPLVFGGTVVTHLVGGSAGREGTAIQMSGSLTDLFARTLRLDHADRVVLLIAAVSGGFGAVFGVPLAGCVFGLEVRGSERSRHAAILPALVASVVGDRIVRGLGVEHTATPTLATVDLSAGLLAKLVVAGVAFGLAALVFHDATQWVRRLAGRVVRWSPARPMLGGVVVLALVAIAGSRAYLGLSVPLLEGAIAGGAGIVGAAFVWKLVFTAVTLGTGFPGGEVTPLFVIGATLGVTMARLLDVPVPLLAAVGFVAVFSAAANTPLACTIMAVELFGPAVLVPAAIACVVARIASTDRTIYGVAPARTVSRRKETDVSQTDDPQGMAEALDSDEVTVDGDPLGGGETTSAEFPPDHLAGVNAYGLTSAEERTGEPIEERATRELPDDLLEALEHGDEPPTGDPAWEDETVVDRVGRLVEPHAQDDGLDAPDDEADAVASSYDEDDLTAEESAMHIVPEAPDV